ncbi:MAG: tryptophan 2,3-dioxygenase family protein [Bacteroidia bacterium]
MEINDKVKSLLDAIEEKYKLEGQEFTAYLEGLLYNDYLSYWDYIQVDALLNLQHPRTNIPDEMIFIIYHQITELYFKLSLWEYDQILSNKNLTGEYMAERLCRINNYFVNLTRSFEIMTSGMEKEQFLKFRLSLMPASGFQSVQYRMIELASTHLINLVDKGKREEVKNASIEDQYNFIYWKYGATEVDTGKKTLTLRQFEDKYAEHLINWAHKHKDRNLLTVYRELSESEKDNTKLVEAMKLLDMQVNVHWPLQHYKTAARYLILQPTDEDIPATGGTNWQKYLPPRFQRRIFFPELWQPEELEGWGTNVKED